VIATSVHDIAIFGFNRQSITRFVLEHPRSCILYKNIKSLFSLSPSLYFLSYLFIYLLINKGISKISVSSSGARGVAVTQAGQVSPFF
jgi:hypothetical protein